MKISNFSIPVIRDAIQTALIRFPLAIISSFVFGIVSIYLIESEKKPEEIQRILFCLAIGLPWFTALHLIAENYLKSISQKWILFTFGFAFLILIFIFIAPDFEYSRLERPIRFFSFFLIAHLMVSLTPFLKAGKINEFWEYNKDAFVSWYYGAFYSLIIYVGLLMALFAIDNLFDAHINSKLYIEIFVIIAAGFHPVYVLSNFPLTNNEATYKASYTKAIRNLCIYILIPLTVIYFVILYAYGFKIIGLGALPHGWVSSLVFGFSGVGMISYLLNYLLPHLEDSKLSSLFKKYFFYILTPLVILLFAAINRRISDYGFTPPRYFVLITGIWLFLSCIYFIFSKSNNIKLIPMSLIVFLLFGTISPFDAFHISISSQYNRLVSLLEKNKVLGNGKINASLSLLSASDKESIKETIYALDRMGSLKKVNNLLSEPILLDTIVYHDPREFLFEKTGLSFASAIKDNSQTIYLSSHDKNDYTISGYDRIFIFNLYTAASDENIILGDIDAKDVIICKKLNDTIPLQELLIKLDEKNTNSGPNGLLKEPFDFNTNLYKHRLYIKNLNYKKSDSRLSVEYMQGVILSGKR